MSSINRALTTSPVVKKISLSNVTETATSYTVLGLSRDAATVYMANGAGLYTSTNDGASPVLAHTFTSESVRGCVMLANGEVGVATASGSGPCIWVSSGWAAGPTSATWTKTLNPGHSNAMFQASFSWNTSSVGSNGYAITNMYGAQTIGDSTTSGNASDAQAATQAFVSLDNCQTWTLSFDLLADGAAPLPNNCHIHSTCYDEPNDRFLMTIGDNTGNPRGGFQQAGTGNAQMAYNDSHGARGSWTFFPTSTFGTEWANCFASQGSAGLQWVTLRSTPYGILFGPDSQPYATWCLPRSGYRTYGHPQVHASRGGRIGEHITQNLGSTAANPKPIFFGYLGGLSGQGYQYRLAASHDNGLTVYDVLIGPVDTGNIQLAAFGPTANGKLIGNTGVNAGLKLLTGTITIAP